MLITILCAIIILMLITLILMHKKLHVKLETLQTPIKFIEGEFKQRNAEHNARKNWKQFRDNNLPKAKVPLSTDEMRQKADELERQMAQ